VLTTSEHDRRTLRELVPGLHASVVPNGVDIDAFSPRPADDSGPPMAVFVGKMDYRPNFEGVQWFCEEILPCIRAEVPDFEFTIVGADPPRAVRSLAGLPGVEVTGFVDDARPYVLRATVVVVPLRAGSGTRLKLLEAFAAGRATVSTTLGREGIDAEDERHLLTADEPEDFARQVVRLLGDPGLRRGLARHARDLVEERYSWSSVSARLEGLYGELVGG
jgi:glycosyltransferase involved in cell wall biosynthesis